MRRTCWGFVIYVGMGGIAAAQEPLASKKWDVLATAALSETMPGDNNSWSRDNWYVNGRYAMAIGHYWTEHLKTEVEYARSGEGSTFVQEFRSLPGVPGVYPYGVEAYHRLEQAAVRMVWQFGKNAWVHPYVSGGVAGDRERERFHVPEQFQYVNGRINDPLLVVRQQNSGPTSEYRIGFTAGAGAKIHLSQNAFFSTGFVGTYSKPAATLSLVAGFGIDF